MKLCVYGGGAIAHSLAAALAQQESVTVFTHHPEAWRNRLVCVKDGVRFESRFPIVATNSIDVIADSDIVFIALPQFAYEQTISSIADRMKSGSTVVFVPAPARAYEYMMYLRLRGIDVVAFQRVPYISRVVEKGVEVDMSSDRAVHRLAVSDVRLEVKWRQNCRVWFGGDVEYLSSFRIFLFNNSNPILHPARMVVLFRDWKSRTYTENPLFYYDWTDESSNLYLAADGELQTLLIKCAEIDADRDYEPLRKHYGVNTAAEMTAKLRSIQSFRSIRSPMRQVGSQWQPDFESRYFTEDVDCGTRAILDYAYRSGSRLPVIKGLYDSMLAIRGVESQHIEIG